jgi:hypothetical protein
MRELAKKSVLISQSSASSAAIAAASAISGAIGSFKTVKVDNILVPRPLFDKQNTALIKLRRDIKMQKLKGWPNYKLDMIKSSMSMQTFVEMFASKDDWTPNEDFIILHVCAIQSFVHWHINH